MKLCSRLLMFLCQSLSEKCQIWVSQSHFGELEVMHNLVWWLIGKATVDFAFALKELFSLSIMTPELWGVMCTVLLFLQAVDLFAVRFYLDRVIPINHSRHQKTRDTGLPDSEDCIPRRSLVLTQYCSVSDRQRQADSRYGFKNYTCIAWSLTATISCSQKQAMDKWLSYLDTGLSTMASRSSSGNQSWSSLSTHNSISFIEFVNMHFYKKDNLSQ